MKIRNTACLAQIFTLQVKSISLTTFFFKYKYTCEFFLCLYLTIFFCLKEKEFSFK